MTIFPSEGLHPLTNNPDKTQTHVYKQAVIDRGELKIRSRKMTKLKAEEITALGLPDKNNVGPIFASALRTDSDGNEQLCYILRTGDGSAFILDPDHPSVQELQSVAAMAAIDSFEAQGPIQTAGAIKAAIKKSGFTFEGGPIEILQFGINAMEKIREFQEVQLKVIQLNAAQAATRRLAEDQALPLGKFMLLPPHRRLSAMMFAETCMVIALQELTNEGTVTASNNIRAINVNLAQRRAELMNMWAEHLTEAAAGIVDRTGKTAIGLIQKLISGSTESGDQIAKVLLGFTFGEDFKDEGLVTGLLAKSGETGEKLLQLIQNSGLTINEFFKNLISGKKESKQEE